MLMQKIVRYSDFNSNCIWRECGSIAKPSGMIKAVSVAALTLSLAASPSAARHRTSALELAGKHWPTDPKAANLILTVPEDVIGKTVNAKVSNDGTFWWADLGNSVHLDIFPSRSDYVYKLTTSPWVLRQRIPHPSLTIILPDGTIISQSGKIVKGSASLLK